MGHEVVNETHVLRQKVTHAKSKGQRIGLVPTMGALHAGHASLIQVARQETSFVVVSIFVNPAQFGPHEDLDRYPRSLPADLLVCEAEGADLVFVPAIEEIYPPGFCTWTEVSGLQDVLCGKSRPGHFRGVATVVLKLFNMVQPNLAYFGQKDFQQARIIQQMVRDLDLPLQIRICPIVRESDGLAISSRNRFLTPEQRTQATVLFHALEGAKRMHREGVCDGRRLQEAMASIIRETPGAKLDYAEIVDAESLEPLERIEKGALAAVAVRFGETRLIDNMLLQGAKRTFE